MKSLEKYANSMQIKKATYKSLRKWLIISSSSWARTKDPLINSQML
jgi:hypothetical protein